MDRKQLMESVEARSNELRIGLSQLCYQAGVSRTVASRWQRGRQITPLLPTIGKLERKLDELEHSA